MVSVLRRSYRRLRFGEPIVVVSGLPRSGTSMAMKMLEAGGLEVFVDGVRVADVDNPKGYYEYERVKNLAQETDKSWLVEARGKAIKIISYLLRELPPSFNYQVVHMRRNVEEVIASQNKMLDHRGEAVDTDDERTRQLLENQLWRAGYLLKTAPQFEHIDLPYTAVLEDPHGQAARLAEFFDGRLDAAKMAAVVDERLYRNRA